MTTDPTLTRTEDLTWMAEHGENLTGAARRLGLNRNSLAKWAKKHAPEAHAQLLAREPIDPGPQTRRNQWTAA